MNNCSVYTHVITIIVYKDVNLNVWYLGKILNENEFIENNENTVDDDPGNVESATDDSNNGNFIRTCKKKFLGCNFVFIK